jgi:hypothetical protein
MAAVDLKLPPRLCGQRSFMYRIVKPARIRPGVRIHDAFVTGLGIASLVGVSVAGLLSAVALAN